MPTDVKCPYCGHPLEEAPKRKKKCPNCENFIFVRDGKPYTEEQAEERDYLKFWLSRLDSAYGFSETDFEQHRARMTEQRGFKADAHDTVWSVLNRISVETQTPDRAVQISQDMALFYEQEGRDYTPHIAQVNKVKALQFKRRAEEYKVAKIVDETKNNEVIEYPSGINYVEILCADDNQSCEYCRSLNRTIHKIDEVPIVPLNCTAKYGCRCQPLAVIDEALPEDFLRQETSKAEEDSSEEDTKAWWQFWK